MIFMGLGINAQADSLRPEGFSYSAPSLLLSTVAINILSLALPIMTLQVYDRILPNPGTGTLPVLVTGVCLAIVLEALLRLCRSYVIARSGAAYEHLIACIAMDKVLGANMSKMGSHGIGGYLHRMGSVGKLKDFYNGFSFTIMVELAFIPLFFGLILYIGSSLVIVPATILFSFIVISLWKGYCVRHALLQREAADDERFNFLIESLEGVHTLKAFALEKFFERRYEQLESLSTFENYNVAQQTAKTFNIGAIFSHIMVSAVICFGAWFVLQGKLSTGGLIATLLLSGRMMQPVQKALALWARYQDYVIARKHLEELLDTPQKIKTEKDDVINHLPDGRLGVYDLSFRYDGEDEGLFSNVNIKLERGEAALISGTHGSGKTTLLKLIAGVYPPSGGEVHVDGEQVHSYLSEDLVRHVGYISTRPVIFRGTIRDNITCFGQIPEARAREISALLKVDKDVAKLPGGFDTFLSGNNTDSITPGLKQRLSMVRALAPKPRIILFDNADRSLDKNGYAAIYSLLARLKGKATMVLISDDQNIRGLAGTHYVLQQDGLIKSDSVSYVGNVSPYRELRL